MTSLLDKLNLRPGERRLVVGVVIVVFIIVNVWFVYPMFGKWSFYENRKSGSQKTLNDYKTEMGKTNGYNAELKKLETLGAPVPAESQAVDLTKTVQNLSILHGSGYETLSNDRGNVSGKTNAFFDEKTIGMTFTSGEKELVDFLYALASGTSMVRVRSATLAPDPSRMKIKGSLTLVASYQRKSPLRPAPPPATKTNQSVKATSPLKPEPAKITAPAKATNMGVRPTPPGKPK